MIYALVKKVKYSDKPPFKIIRTDYEFVENGNSKHIIELKTPLKNIIMSVIIRDLIKGKFGTNPKIYEWINRPTKVENGKSVQKLNYVKL